MRNYAKSTVYQVYTKSFQDSNGDGIGDIRGVTSRLDYLKELGVDYIWMTPFFKSPLNDNGYDVADYYGVDPVFGTMEDVEELISEADKRGMGLMFDMVFNHTSTQHEWFQKALTGDPRYLNYYIFRDPVNGGAPTNWESKFGGNAWEYVPSLGKYYLHLFDATQADLNWDNPEVREELKNVLRFWKDKGLKGFRFDVVNLISKPEKLENDYEGVGKRFYTDGPNVHEYIRELITDSGIEGMVTVGEMSATSIDNCVRYTNPDEHELAMTFSFHHLKVDYKDGDKWELMAPDIPALKKLLADWQVGMEAGNGWNATFWCNHDQPRAVSRFCDDGELRERSAKMLATAIHFLRGTPYVFQGDEIGVTNAHFTSINQYRDVESLNYYKIMLENGKTEAEALHILGERSRDNGRTPMQWDASKNSGFTTGTPWLDVNKNYLEINVAEQVSREDSVFAYYKKLIALRKELDVISDGSFEPIENVPDKIFAYRRKLDDQELLVYVSFSDSTEYLPSNTELSGFRVLVANTNRNHHFPDYLTPYEAVVYYKDGITG